MNNKMKMFYLQAINVTIHETAAQIIKVIIPSFFFNNSLLD